MPLKAIHDILLELWLKIFSYLPEISPRKFSVAFRKGLPISNTDLKHSKVWDIIFDDYKFLDYMTDRLYPCILLGSDLHLLYNLDAYTALRERPNPWEDVYLVLLLGNCQNGEISDGRDFGLEFAKSAKKELGDQIRRRVKDRTVPETLYFRHYFPQDPSGGVRITLNIESLWSPKAKSIFLDHPEKLVSLKGHYLYSAYLHWKYDGKLLRDIEPSDIIGRGRYASVCGTIDSVKHACGFTVQQPQDTPRRKHWHHQDHEHWDFLRKCQRNFPWQVKFEINNGERVWHREKFEWGDGERKRCLGWEHSCSEEYREKEWKYDPVMEHRRVLSEKL
ncbi:uncharacterized protein PAC_15223 [Phialocephala subalpina]|uniref:Uncharacterized protein n=1 Tax=Phialocephala subalpina TaxID=576137 RepID=A0A1L7XJY5_9HELO|nr:uncharacterized protein PAC_15223 [Phialocephala subalpina]